MKRALLCSVLVLASCGAGLCAGEAVKPARPAMDDAAIKQLLNTKHVSFDFVETPFHDVCGFIRQLLGVNLVLDPGVEAWRPVTLRVNNMKAGAALQWIAKVGGATMAIKDAVIYIAPEKMDRKAQARLRDLERLRQPPDPASLFKVHARVRELERELAAQRERHGALGRIQLNLGGNLIVEMQLREDMLGPETVELMRQLLHQALVAQAKKLGAKMPHHKEPFLKKPFLKKAPHKEPLLEKPPRTEPPPVKGGGRF